MSHCDGSTFDIKVKSIEVKCAKIIHIVDAMEKELDSMVVKKCTGQTDHPKSQCEQHRDSLQSGLELDGPPSLGAFIPQCDTDGSYRPLQVGPDTFPLTD